MRNNSKARREQRRAAAAARQPAIDAFNEAREALIESERIAEILILNREWWATEMILRAIFGDEKELSDDKA